MAAAPSSEQVAQETKSCAEICKAHRTSWEYHAKDNTAKYTELDKEYMRGCIDTARYLEGKIGSRIS